MHPKALAALATVTLHAFNPVEVEQFLAGLVTGLVQEDDFTKIQTCLVDAYGLERQIQTALGDFMKGDLQDILKGVKEMGAILSEVPADLGDCKAMSGDIARIESWAQIFKDPKALVSSVVKNVLTHGPAIAGDISKTVSDIGNADMTNAGVDVADLLVLTLGKVPAAVDPETLEVTQW